MFGRVLAYRDAKKYNRVVNRAECGDDFVFEKYFLFSSQLNDDLKDI